MGHFWTNLLRGLLPVIYLFTAACSTSSTIFQTPTGLKSGDQFGRFDIIGVSNMRTQSLNRQDGKKFFVERVRISVPVGTELIIPSLSGWSLGYGKSDPEVWPDLASNLNAQAEWVAEDHNLGLAWITVGVEDINAPDLTTDPPSQTATIAIAMLLRDDNADDKWLGFVQYKLMYLARHQDRIPKDHIPLDRPIPPIR